MTTDQNGVLTVEMRYREASLWDKACSLRCAPGVLCEGETRYVSGATPTDYRYTSQREDASIGLYFYREASLWDNARWYDPYINHFTQPDTLIPNPGNPLDWDRYLYVLANPLRYTDPSGHVAIGDSNEGGCNTPGSPKCILDKYYGASTENDWMMDMELYYYQKAYSDYDVTDDPYIDSFEAALINAPMLRESCVGGSFSGCAAFAAEGMIGGTLASPKIVQSSGSAPQNYGNDPADPDCAGCGYQLPWSEAPGEWTDYVPIDFQSAFDGTPQAVTTNAPLATYKYSANSPTGPVYWVTVNPNLTPDQARTVLALPNSNSAVTVTPITIPKGTNIVIGTVAGQTGNPLMGSYAIGGGFQIYIPAGITP